MAIVKMKRLHGFAMLEDREALLEKLQTLGCLEIGESADKLSDPEWAGVVKPSGHALSEARETKAQALSALDILKKYAPAKSPLLKARPQISREALFDEDAYRLSRESAQAVCDAEKEINTLYAEQSKLRAQKLSLVPWLGLDVALDAASTQEVTAQFGTLPATVDLGAFTAALGAASPLYELTAAGRDREFQYLFLLCHKSAGEAVGKVLQDYAFSKTPFRGLTGTAAENDRRLDKELEESAQAVEAAKAHIKEYGGARESLKLCADRAEQDIRRETAKCRLLDTGETFFFEGWAPAASLPELEALFAQYDCAWDSADPTGEQIPDVPVRLKNNPITYPLNMVTEMYSLPAYDGLDPNPLMAPFFILFYGIMLADMGYGILMIVASLVVVLKMRPKAGTTMDHMFRLAGLCGVSTFLFGALTGGFFGDFVPQLMKLLNIIPADSTFTWFWPTLFTPLNDTLIILVGAMCLGFVQIVTGMAVSFIKKCKDGELMDGIFEEVTWWIVFAGLALAILGVTPIVLVLGGVLILAGAVWGAKDRPGFGKVVGTVTGIFGSLYNHVTGYFGDILSYSRLMALMLAGSVIAQVFNTLGAIPGNIVIFLIISFAGNALNFALNLLGCYVHDLRLQCLEYFGKFYKDGGRPFRPLEINTKYVDVTNN